MPSVIPGWLVMAPFAHHEGNIFRLLNGASRSSRMARQERFSRQNEVPHARKNVTHIVTILCVQGAPRYLLSLLRHTPNFSFFPFLFPFL